MSFLNNLIKYRAAAIAAGAYVGVGGGLNQKSVWYRMRQHSGGSLVDAMGNGPDIPMVDVAGTPNVWGTAKRATPPNDGTGKASTYARVIGNAYLDSLCALEPLIASQGLLFFAADIYPQTSAPDKTQTIFQVGAGTGAAGNPQGFALTQHITSGAGRVRINDTGITFPIVTAETPALSISGGAGVTRNALCGYIDCLNGAVGVSVNGGAFITAAIDFSIGAWDDTDMALDGFCMLALNPAGARTGTIPIQYMGGSASTLGTGASGLFITRFETHPGLDLIDQLATSFNETVGNFPDDLRTGKY